MSTTFLDVRGRPWALLIVLVGVGGPGEPERKEKEQEAGVVWLNRLKAHFKHIVWINPNPSEVWKYYQSTVSLLEIMDNKMYPMSIEGIRTAIEKLLKPAY